MQFTPLGNFTDDELMSSYLVGLSYTVRPGDVLLAAKVPEWLKQGKVRLGAPDAKDTVARVTGAGKVE